MRVLPEAEEDIAGLDDDELEDLQCLLWRGYEPEPHVRVWYGPYEDHYRVDPALRKRVQPERAPRKKYNERPFKGSPSGRKLFGRFECGRCGQWFYSSTPEDQVDADFIAQFGEAAMAKRVAVCEGCFDILVGQGEVRH